jgi:hypothetical protein
MKNEAANSRTGWVAREGALAAVRYRPRFLRFTLPIPQLRNPCLAQDCTPLAGRQEHFRDANGCYASDGSTHFSYYLFYCIDVGRIRTKMRKCVNV